MMSDYPAWCLFTDDPQRQVWSTQTLQQQDRQWITCNVVVHVTIRLAMGYFFWVVHCDHASILHRYEDEALNGGRTDAQVILYSVESYP